MKSRVSVNSLMLALTMSWPVLGARVAWAQNNLTCPQLSTPAEYSGPLLGNSMEERSGVGYDSGLNALRLARTGGTFAPTTAPSLAEPIVTAAGADFNRDGREEYVGGTAAGDTYVYRNTSAPGLPSFVQAVNLGRETTNVHMALAAGDFNGDTRPDIVRINIGAADVPQSMQIFMNTGNDAAGNAQFTAPQNALLVTPASTLGRMPGYGSNVVVVDVNGDRKLDLLVGSGDGTGGTIRKFLNQCTLQMPPPPLPPPLPFPCTDTPRFTYGGDLIANMGLGSGAGELPVFAYADFTSDFVPDLVAGAPECCTAAATRLRLWRGQPFPPGTLDTSTSQSLTFTGGASVVLGKDFTRDGKPDLMVGTDADLFAPSPGGRVFYYQNNGTATPFSAAPSEPLTGLPPDIAWGVAINYDNDTDGTLDVMFGDDTATPNVDVFTNQASGATFVNCGMVMSTPLDLGALSSEEMVITGGRLKPVDVVLNGGFIQWYLMNDRFAPVPAANCGDGSGDVCANFPQATRREIRWRADLCAVPPFTQTPLIREVEVSFNYTPADEHFRAGTVVSDGVAYLGGFRQPGDRGFFYAASADLTQIYWEFSAKLDAMAQNARNIFMVSGTLPASLEPIPFKLTGVPTHDNKIMSTLGTAPSATNTQTILDYVLDIRRFGVGNSDIAMTRLGAVETSTAAVVTRPGLPIWYALASTADRDLVDNFIQANFNREPLILVGSRNGMIHAIRNNPTNITAPTNGMEAWAMIPNTVAKNFLPDFLASVSTVDPNDHVITSYPDGSPTVADIKNGGGAMSTVAVVGSGNGGSAVLAMDITSTLDPSSGVVTPPLIKWETTPSGANAGKGNAKPVIARVKIGGAERFIVVTGTGVGVDNSKGRIVVAFDANSGALLWQFETKCPLTSHVAVFETDDETGTAIDGFMDRAVFADRCGNVYKVDPGRDLGGTWNENIDGTLGLGSIPLGLGSPSHSGRPIKALFATAASTNGLLLDPADPDASKQRPIAGTLAARVDGSARVVLYFGTGGREDYDPRNHNEFFAVYADDGTVRSKLVGTCQTTPTRHCEKFYGGVVVTAEQVIFTRSTDPRVGAGICDLGSAKIQAVNLDGNPAEASVENFLSEFEVSIASAAVGNLYGDAGAVYLGTLGGEVVRVGSPRAPQAGGDSATGAAGGFGSGAPGEGQIGTNAPLMLLGWRQVF